MLAVHRRAPQFDAVLMRPFDVVVLGEAAIASDNTQNARAARLGLLQAGHPRGASLKPTLAQLADAQLVLARENGFASWPKLKARTEALREARAAAKRPDLAAGSPQQASSKHGSTPRAASPTASCRAGNNAAPPAARR